MARQTSNNQAWTTKQLITLSNSMAIAYGNGVTSAQRAKRQDTWTTEQLIHMSNSFGQI
jgi:hypothetical protein